MQLKHLLDLNPTELWEFVQSRRLYREATPTKGSKTKSVAALAAAWNVPKEKVALAAEAVLCSKREDNHEV